MVRVGSSVMLRYGQLEERWRIVDASEADATQGMISDGTPLARALLGPGAGDQVQVQGPASQYAVTILSVG